MWIKLNSLSGLISMIYPQGMLVSEKKNLPILGFFSNKYRLLAIHIIKLDNFEDSNKKAAPYGGLRNEAYSIQYHTGR